MKLITWKLSLNINSSAMMWPLCRDRKSYSEKHRYFWEKKPTFVSFTRIGCAAAPCNRLISEYIANRLFFWTKMFSFKLLLSQRCGGNGGTNTRGQPLPRKREDEHCMLCISIISTNLQSLACTFFPLFLSAGFIQLLKTGLGPSSFFTFWKNLLVIRNCTLQTGSCPEKILIL